MHEPNHTLTLKGVGVVTKTPDVMVLNTTLIHKAHTSSEALKHLDENYQRLLEVYQTHGFDAHTIHTSTLNMMVFEEGESRVRVIQCSQDIVLKAALDMKKLAVLLSSFQDQPAMNLSLSYEYSDAKGAHQEALQAAVMDATTSAHVIAKSADVSIGSILKIESVDDDSLPFGLRKMSMDTQSMSMHPTDVSFTQSVTITWCLNV